MIGGLGGDLRVVVELGEQKVGVGGGGEREQFLIGGLGFGQAAELAAGIGSAGYGLNESDGSLGRGRARLPRLFCPMVRGERIAPLLAGLVDGGYQISGSGV